MKTLHKQLEELKKKLEEQMADNVRLKARLHKSRHSSSEVRLAIEGGGRAQRNGRRSLT
jgi:regulator of replication initiation timing